MLNLLANVTSVADQGPYLSTVYQFLKFIIINTSGAYATCGCIIVLCMFATALRNLIYKVLNLAVLSVFVVALWAFLTDVTFIYVVYILTFVSAVVMLFLSVVLMLPSSAISVAKRNFSPALLAIGASTPANGVAASVINITAGLVYACFIIITVYSVILLVKASKTASSSAGIIKLAPLTRNAVLELMLRRFSIIRFYNFIMRFFTSAANGACNMSKLSKLHPALIFKLASCSGINLPVDYRIGFLYYKFINFVFTNVELPLSTKTDGKSGFPVFAKFYDMLVPASSTSNIVYTVKPGQYMSGEPRINKLIFVKNFIIFSVVNLVSSTANVTISALAFLSSPTNLELAVQAITVVSIFFIALPVGLVGS